MAAGEALAAMATVLTGCTIARWLPSLALRAASIVEIFWGPAYRERTRAFLPRRPAVA